MDEKTKKEILEKANVLIISDDEKEYGYFKDYGFKNIVYFKSAILAGNYFRKHFDQLEDFHLIIMGHLYAKSDFADKLYIDKLISHVPALFAEVTIYDDGCYIYYRGTPDVTKAGNTEWMIDNIVEHLNAWNNPIRYRRKPVEIIKEEKTIALPRKKKDLKILFMCQYVLHDCVEETAEKLGLNVTFSNDNNFSFENYIRNFLGEYDIIIASELFSTRVVLAKSESTELCKAAGRKLAMLSIYKYNDINVDYTSNVSIGDNVKMEYVFAGELGEDSELEDVEFDVLSSLPKQGAWDTIRVTEAILSEAVNLYNNKLKELKLPELEDMNLKNGEDYNAEYQTEAEIAKKRLEEDKIKKEQEMVPITLYDDLYTNVCEYLNHTKRRYYPLEGLKIFEKDDEIYIENNLNGRILCRLILPSMIQGNTIRLFKVQTLSKKGALMPPHEVALYTSNDNEDELPPKLNEAELSAFSSIMKKADKVLLPCVQEFIKQDYKRKRYRY